MTHDLRTMARALGGEVCGRDTVLAPGPGHSPKDRSLSVTLSPAAPDGFVVNSFSTKNDPLECKDYVRERLGMPQWRPGDGRNRRIYPSRAPSRDAQTIDREIEKTEEARQKLALARAIWAEAVDPRGTLAEKYLRLRGLELPTSLCGRVLRFHPRVWLKTERRDYPAVIAAWRPIIGDINPDAPPVAIQRIYLQPSGEAMRDLETGKRVKLSLAPTAGCAIKLTADEDIEQSLNICEGLETGLPLYCAGWPMWALGGPGIRTFPVLAGITSLGIFADHDPNGAGEAAALACCDTWRNSGAHVFARYPNNSGEDFADVLKDG